MPSESRAVVEMTPNAIPSAPSTSCAKKPIPIRAKNSGVNYELCDHRTSVAARSLRLLRDRDDRSGAHALIPLLAQSGHSDAHPRMSALYGHLRPANFKPVISPCICAAWQQDRPDGRVWTARARHGSRAGAARSNIPTGRQTACPCPQLACDRLGGLVAEIDIEHGNIAAGLPHQPKGLGHRNRRADDFKAGIRQLSGDIEREQGVILDHKHAFVHVCIRAMSARPIASLVSPLHPISLWPGTSSRQISPDGAKSSWTSPSRLNSAMLLMTVEPKPR